MNEKAHDSLAGNLLIAIPDLHDPNFFRSVVILFQHTNEGASGVILNRPTDVPINKVWSEVGDDSECVRNEHVNIGGPVEGPLIALHTSLAMAESQIIPGVFMSVSRERLDQLVSQDEQQLRLYSGYSGWGPGQLESEIERGGWLTLPASANDVFDTPVELWKQVCDRVGHDILKPHLGKHVPDDPSLN